MCVSTPHRQPLRQFSNLSANLKNDLLTVTVWRPTLRVSLSFSWFGEMATADVLFCCLAVWLSMQMKLYRLHSNANEATASQRTEGAGRETEMILCTQFNGIRRIFPSCTHPPFVYHVKFIQSTMRLSLSLFLASLVTAPTQVSAFSAVVKPENGAANILVEEATNGIAPTPIVNRADQQLLDIAPSVSNERYKAISLQSLDKVHENERIIGPDCSLTPPLRPRSDLEVSCSPLVIVQVAEDHPELKPHLEDVKL